MTSSPGSANAEVIAKIEAVFENITDSLLKEQNPYVPLNDIFVPLRNKRHTAPNADTSSLLDVEPSDDFINVSFPARGRPKEAWRFSTIHPVHHFAMVLIASPAVLVRILDLVHEALCDNVIVSKRCVSITILKPQSGSTWDQDLADNPL